jgi:hypothetical protein
MSDQFSILTFSKNFAKMIRVAKLAAQEENDHILGCCHQTII